MEDHQLIFIVSQPRSGSTLLQALLTNNNQVATSNESWLLLAMQPLLSGKQTGSFRYDKLISYALNENLVSKVGKENYHFLIRQFILSAYSQVLKQHAGPSMLVDKTPRYYEILDAIREVLPTAKIIILKREPLAVLSSMIDFWGIDRLDRLFHGASDLIDAPLLLEDFLAKEKNNDNTKCVFYEDLVEDSLTTLKELYDWIGLDFSESVLKYSHNVKYLGKLGDQKVLSMNKPSPNQLKSWQARLKHPIWNNFFVGYAHYLKERLPSAYPYNYDFKTKETKTFRYFFKLHQKRFNETSSSLKISDIPAYCFYRLVNRITKL
jgi:hypothetical protein